MRTSLARLFLLVTGRGYRELDKCVPRKRLSKARQMAVRLMRNRTSMPVEKGFKNAPAAGLRRRPGAVREVFEIAFSGSAPVRSYS